MVAEGSFPFREDDDEYEEAPRVGDGVIMLESDLRVTFASPNAVSSMHRMGIFSYTLGLAARGDGLRPGGRRDRAPPRLAVTEEIERGDTSVLLRVMPLSKAARRPAR